MCPYFVHKLTSTIVFYYKCDIFQLNKFLSANQLWGIRPGAPAEVFLCTYYWYWWEWRFGAHDCLFCIISVSAQRSLPQGPSLTSLYCFLVSLSILSSRPIACLLFKTTLFVHLLGYFLPPSPTTPPPPLQDYNLPKDKDCILSVFCSVPSAWSSAYWQISNLLNKLMNY